MMPRTASSDNIRNWNVLLVNMLAASNFQAVIRLVLDGGGKLNNLQSELVKRIPSRYSGLIMSETSGKYKAFAEKGQRG